MLPGFGAVLGAMMALFVIAGAAIVLYMVALVYVALRVQDTRQSTPDPKLGMKLAFHTVHTTAVLIALSGASVFMIDAMLSNQPQPNFGGPAPARGGDGLSEAKRTAIALVASGVLFGLVFWAFLLGTNDSEQRSVRRVFVGGRLALCLLITMFTVTGLLVNLAQKTSDTRATEVLTGMLLVWFPAAIVHMLLFFMNVNTRSARKRAADDDEDDRPWRPER